MLQRIRGKRFQTRQAPIFSLDIMPLRRCIIDGNENVRTGNGTLGKAPLPSGRHGGCGFSIAWVW